MLDAHLSSVGGSQKGVAGSSEKFPPNLLACALWSSGSIFLWVFFCSKELPEQQRSKAIIMSNFLPEPRQANGD